MASGRLVKIGDFVCLAAILAMAGAANATIATFEDLDLPPESYWNGSDGSGGFTSGGAHLGNNYNANWGSWDGFSYSNVTDTTTAGLAGQYNAIAGAGQGGSANYAVGYIGWTSPPTVTLSVPGVVDGLHVTNSNYAYYSMLNGDAFAKKFGGASGDDQDWFVLTITGKDAAGVATGTVDFYLADYRFADNAADYIVETWQYVDLTSLGPVKSLEFSLNSSDVSDWGMNTPASFAIDTIVYELASPFAGPYTEPGVNGYVNPNNRWRHADPLKDPNAIINPIFRGWATGFRDYLPADDEWFGPAVFNDATRALGPATGDNVGDIVSLGDLDQSEIDLGVPPGRITLLFGDPCNPNDLNSIRNVKGYDFVVFENGVVSLHSTTAGSVAGQMLAELGYVEVSSNGSDFVRFPAVSLTREPAGPYGTIEVSNVHNLAGKHPNANGLCTGTPFDLQDISGDPNVVSGVVDVNNIKYVRIVDVPGSGDFDDEAVMHIDPYTWPVWNYYSSNHPIYDAWPTWGSGGLDLEAVGVLKEQRYSADIDLNGVVDMFDFAMFASAWHGRFGWPGWAGRCDLAEPKDLVVDTSDLAAFAAQWLEVEQWRY